MEYDLKTAEDRLSGKRDKYLALKVIALFVLFILSTLGN